MKKGLNISTFSNIEKSVKEEQPKKKSKKDLIIESVLQRCFLSGSEQIELKDLIDEISNKKGVISEEGIVTCYYALSKYNKKSFDKDGTVGAGSDKVMLSTKNTPNLKKYGDEIITLYIPIERLYFVAETKEEILLKIPFRSARRKMNLKQFKK